MKPLFGSIITQAGKEAWQLRVRAALPEDPRSIPRKSWGLTTFYNSSSGEIYSLLASGSSRYKCGTQTYTKVKHLFTLILKKVYLCACEYQYADTAWLVRGQLQVSILKHHPPLFWDCLSPVWSFPSNCRAAYPARPSNLPVPSSHTWDYISK